MDRISKLPPGIIETILCLLPIQETARTSILSREWRYRWINIPKLSFIESKFQVSTDGAELSVLEQICDEQSKRNEMTKRRKFFYAIFQVLLRHQGPIHEFTLSMITDSSCVEINRIIPHLSKKNVKILKFDFVYQGYDPSLMSLFSLNQLTELHLDNCSLFDECPYNEFGCLTTLYLGIIMASEKTLLRLLSSCPLLKRLTLKSGRARIFLFGKSTIVDLFECLPMIEYLHVSLDIVNCFHPDRLPKALPTTLVHLKFLCVEDMSFTRKYSLPFLGLLIRSSPNLEKLNLEMRGGFWPGGDTGFFTGKDYSDITFEHLTELEILDFRDAENEMDFVKRILAESPMLKKVRIFLYPRCGEDEESRITKILLCSPQASPKVKVIIKKFNT